MRTLNPNTLERVENYITEYQKKNGKSPSYRQIMHGVGMSSLNLVQRYVLALEREGRIERTRIGNISVPPKLKPSGVAIAPLVGSIAWWKISKKVLRFRALFSETATCLCSARSATV